MPCTGQRTECRVRRVRAYVDGFNLYHGMHAAFGRAYLWLDVEALAGSLLRADQRLDRVKYFPPKRHSDELRRVADAVYWLGRDKLARAQLPTKVVTTGGIELHRPGHWS
jgi:hypothetical protein